MRFAKLFVCLGVALSITRPGFGFNKAGHMVTGALAYTILKRTHPDVLAKVLALLEAHPQFDERWAQHLHHVSPRNQDAVLFMLAARWPDDVRGDEDFDQPLHHFINLPFKSPNAPADVRIKAPRDENIVVAYRGHLSTLNGNESDQERAISLCWLFHLTGDVMQPLHSATLFSGAFKHGDRGATKFFVKDSPDGDPVSLHSLWDGVVIESEEFGDVQRKARHLHNQFPANALSELTGQFAPIDFDTKWLMESFELAKSKAYLDGTLAGGADREHAIVLPVDYTVEVRNIMERRMAIAGYRLAAPLAKQIN